MKYISEHSLCIGNVTDYVLDLGINAHVRHTSASLKWNRNSVFRPNLFSTRYAQTLDRFSLLPCLCCLPPSHQQTLSVPTLRDIPLPSVPLPTGPFLSTPLQVSTVIASPVSLAHCKLQRSSRDLDGAFPPSD